MKQNDDKIYIMSQNISGTGSPFSPRSPRKLGSRTLKRSRRESMPSPENVGVGKTKRPRLTLMSPELTNAPLPSQRPPLPPRSRASSSSVLTGRNEPLPRLLTQGAFGCIYKSPPMKCNDPRYGDEYYNDKLTKFMDDKDAMIEMKEYETMARIDPDAEFYVGMPMVCKPRIYPAEVYADCKISKARGWGENAAGTFMTLPPAQIVENKKLLVLKDGGQSIAIYASENENKTIPLGEFELFWLAIYKLLHGLLLYKKNGIMHFDLKPQNIVYDVQTHDMKFIDFGLTQSIEMAMSKESRYWWSYPWESGIFNKDGMTFLVKAMEYHDAAGFMAFVRKKIYPRIMTDPQHVMYFNTIYNKHFDPTQLNSENSKEYRETVKSLFGSFYGPALQIFYMNLYKFFISDNPELATKVPLTPPYPVNWDDFGNGNKKTEEEIKNLEVVLNDHMNTVYDYLKQGCMQTFDLFGVGISMMYFLSRVKPEGYADDDNVKSLISELTQYINCIITPNLFGRCSTNDAIAKLWAILTKYNIPAKHPEFINDAKNKKYFTRGSE
jgi:hypothetical protein